MNEENTRRAIVRREKINYIKNIIELLIWVAAFGVACAAGTDHFETFMRTREGVEVALVVFWMIASITIIIQVQKHWRDV